MEYILWAMEFSKGKKASLAVSGLFRLVALHEAVPSGIVPKRVDNVGLMYHCIICPDIAPSFSTRMLPSPV